MFEGSKILITGGTGSLGKRLVRTLFDKFRPKKVIILSRDEYKQSIMAKGMEYGGLRFLLGDVRDEERLCRVFAGVDYVIHAAALKQVPTLEYNPLEAVKTNVLGTQNVVSACLKANVKRAVLISTDKAVNPINLYGATKLCAEKLFLAANSYNKTIFSCVRYGNVMASRGSVIELFQNLKEQGIKKFPVTNRDMTRFWITLSEAAELVIKAFSSDGKIVVPLIPSMRMEDVAYALGAEEIEEIGIRAGEKMHECLISEDNEKVVWVSEEGFYEPDIYTSDKNAFMSKEEFLCKLNS